MLDAFGEICLNTVFLVRSINLILFIFGCMLTKTAATSERLINVPLQNGHVAFHFQQGRLRCLLFAIRSWKEKRIPSFARTVPFLFMCALPILPLGGFWEFLHFFIFTIFLILHIFKFFLFPTSFIIFTLTFFLLLKSGVFCFVLPFYKGCGGGISVT